MKKTDLDQLRYSSPIIIAGIGGSGTRVVAEILIRAGVYLGHDLNKSNDNLLFTYLFKHVYNFPTGPDDLNQKRMEALALHHKLLFGYTRLTPAELWLILKLGWAQATNRYNGLWVLNRWQKAFRYKPGATPPRYWGWKEPHSLFFLPGISAFYPNAKFVLVVRNGLDMVYSRNKQQFEYWGKAFQIDSNDRSPQNEFEFWYRSNLYTINLAHELFKDNFLLLNFEEMCLESERIVPKLLTFAGVEDEVTNELIQIPRLPKSYRRYQSAENTSWIDASVEQKLYEIGCQHF